MWSLNKSDPHYPSPKEKFALAFRSDNTVICIRTRLIFRSIIFHAKLVLAGMLSHIKIHSIQHIVRFSAFADDKCWQVEHVITIEIVRCKRGKGKNIIGFP